MILGHFCRPLLWHHKELLYNYRASDSSNTIFVIYRHIYVQGDTGIVPIYSLKAAEGSAWENLEMYGFVNIVNLSLYIENSYRVL